MIATPKYLRFQSESLEQRYLEQINAALVHRLIVEARSEQAREALAHAVGIDDDTLLAELAELGFVKQTLITLRLMPLVLVAWADNEVDAKERDVILEAARRLGIRKDTDAFVILNHWLKHKPPAQMTDAWKRYICGLLKGFGVAPRRRLIENVHSQMLAVANASGGLLGVGRVSSKERTTIALLDELLKSCAAVA